MLRGGRGRGHGSGSGRTNAKREASPYVLDSLSNQVNSSADEQKESVNNEREQIVKTNAEPAVPDILREVVNQMTQFAQVVDRMQVAVGLQTGERQQGIPDFGNR